MTNTQQILATSVALLAAGLAQAQTPLAQWTFDDDAGNTAANTGSIGSSLDLTMFNSSNVAADLSTAPGVNGIGTAIDFSTATAMGNGTGPRASVAANVTDSYSTLTGLTVTGWLNTADLFTGSSGTLIRNYNTTSGARGGFQIITANAAGGDGLRLVLGTGIASPQTVDFNVYGNTVLTQADTWVFFAATWSNSGSNNLDWYAGDVDTAVAVANTGTTNVAVTHIANTNFGKTVIGRNDATTGGNGFDGLMDDIRIYDTALNVNQIETIRASALTAIPEPSSAAALGGLFALGCALQRRRRRS